jgi:hypothetical protein
MSQVTLIKVGLLEAKTNHINITQGFYACKTKVYLRRTRQVYNQ